MRRLETLLGDWTGRAAPDAPRAPLRPAALAVLEEAERRLGDTCVPDALWHGYLDATRRPAFLQALGTAEARDRWAETAFAAVRGIAQARLDEPATVMFTSGSTGTPKGVVHTGHALVAKRFARAAALPSVGSDETLLCYLPLFHTFGRYFEIVDRLKDVYKNTRGQTVAPAAVERRLADVPGVRRAFLVGDGRDHNALLIVPDRSDPVLAGAAPEAEDAYFQQIVAAVLVPPRPGGARAGRGPPPRGAPRAPLGPRPGRPPRGGRPRARGRPRLPRPRPGRGPRPVRPPADALGRQPGTARLRAVQGRLGHPARDRGAAGPGRPRREGARGRRAARDARAGARARGDPRGRRACLLRAGRGGARRRPVDGGTAAPREPPPREPAAPPPGGARLARRPGGALPRLPDPPPRRAPARLGGPARLVRRGRPAVPHRREHRRDRAGPAGAPPARGVARAPAPLPGGARVAGSPGGARGLRGCPRAAGRGRAGPARVPRARTGRARDLGPLRRRPGPRGERPRPPRGPRRVVPLASEAGAGPGRGARAGLAAGALAAVLADPGFLSQSVALAFDEPEAHAVGVGAGGVWVGRLPSSQRHRLYRASFETTDARHRDLLLALRGDVAEPAVEETILWAIALADRAGAAGIVPRFGCARADLGVLSTAYWNVLSLWERVRAWAGDVGEVRTPEAWRSLFVRGLAAFFSAWRASDGRILPGNVVPTNVAVPRADYLADTRVLSLAGFRPYEGPLSLVEPMQRHFLDQTVGHYPALRGRLDPAWIWDAAVEGLGLEPARAFLDEVLSGPGEPPGGRGPLVAFREALDASYYEPLALRGAVTRYAEWRRSNPRATPAARRQLARQMSGLYGLDAHGDAARYHLYRRTYFEHAAPAVARLFDRLLARLVERPGEPATRLVELSELQSALGSTEDRRALGELVFPRAESLQDAEVRRAPGAGRALVLSRVRDDRGLPFAVREPIGPSEVGRLLRLLSEAGLAAGTLSSHLVLLDTEERVVGGIAWRHDAPRVAHLEGIVVAPGLRSHGLALALVEDFCARRTSAGDVAVHTHFGPGPFPFAPGFGVDRRWGGLVRLLEKDPGPAARSDGP